VSAASFPVAKKEPVLPRLTERFGDAVVASHADLGDETAVVKREALHDVMAFLRDDPGTAFDLPVDVTVVDHLPRKPRFEVVYHLTSTRDLRRIRVKVTLDAADASVASVKDLWPGMDWHEREAFDMYGVIFEGHGDLRRILLYPEFQGHPLRKDYPKTKRQPRLGIEDPG